jgi:hypothetical protein
MNWVISTLSSGYARAAKSSHGPRRGRIVLAVFGFSVCVTSFSFGQTTQPRQKDPKREQAPPQDSPEPLANARRPYQALFGGANTGPRRQTSVSFNGSVSEVYDRDEVEDGEPQLGGLYTNFTGDLDYGRYGSRVQIAATGGANLRYYSQLSEFLAADYHAGAGVGTRVAPHTTMLISETVAYSPVALPGLFANPLPPELGEPLPPDSKFAVTKDKVVTAVTTASVEHGFSLRSQLVANGSYRYTNYLAESTPTSDWSTLDSGVAYRYRVTATRSLRMGYNYRRANYNLPEAPGGRGPQPHEHNLFIGVAADRSFSDEQRTTVSFDGGVSALSVPDPTNLLQASDQLRFVFDAVVAHQIGKSWLLLGSFDRGSQFNQGYGGPVFADALYVSATGFLNARTDVTASFAHTEGESVLTLSGRPFTTSAASARIRYALSRRWALTAEYFRYTYDFTSAPGFPTLIGVPERFTRNSLRGGVSMFLPISPR